MRVRIKIDKTYRSQIDLYNFILYLQENKEQRLFQALRNWLGCDNLQADGVDTFYLENIGTGEKVENNNDLRDVPKQDLPKDRKAMQRDRKATSSRRHKVNRLDKTTPAKSKKNRKKIL